MKQLFGVAAAFYVFAVVFSFECFAASRMDRSRFLIGGYCFKEALHDESHVKDLKECGIDFVVTGVKATDRGALDLLSKYSIGAVVSGVVPSWWGGDGSRAGRLRETNPVERYEEALAAFVKSYDHPSIWMIDLCDEPSALDMPYLGELCALVARRSPATVAYLNLYPNYASVSQNSASQTRSQLGTATYREHIDVYCRTVPLDYLSYDFYVYSRNAAARPWLLVKMYENYNIVSEACRRTGRSMWYIPQVNSRPGKDYIVTTENMLRFQAHTSMAFGAEAVSWACLMRGWWTNNVYTVAGVKTEQFDRLKTVNAELRRLGPEYIRYRNTATHYVDFGSVADLAKLGVAFPDVLDAGWVAGLGTKENTPMLAGEMVSREAGDPSRAFFVVPADDPYDEERAVRNVSFRLQDGMTVKIHGGRGEITPVRSAAGEYVFPLAQSAAALIVVRPPRGG